MDGWIADSMPYVGPLAGACLAGLLIGLEREFRGHPAGLRTHMLICLTSALLMLAATHQMEWLKGQTPEAVIRIDPVRMAHGVLTGIGFLCGGVIFRQGLSVHGLTTAASMWVTSALGTLYGVGAWGLAISGTVACIVILAGFRWVDEHLPQSNIIDVVVRYRKAGDFPEGPFRALMAELNLKPRGMRHRLTSEGECIEIGATLRGPSGAQTSELARRLCNDPRIVKFDIDPRND